MEELLKDILSQIQVMLNKIEKRFDETNQRITKLETTIENTTNV
ncbi:MAG: hypothetical protein ACYDG2_09155 [Ruminiclostridium sp.]